MDLTLLIGVNLKFGKVHTCFKVFVFENFRQMFMIVTTEQFRMLLKSNHTRLQLYPLYMLHYQLKNMKLNVELIICSLCLIHFSTVGKEYEGILEEKLKQLGVWFLDETELRRRGYDKTPDFKLELPIGTHKK